MEDETQGRPYLEQVYPCGCRARVCECGCGSNPEIVDCTLHGSAEELLVMVKSLLTAYVGVTGIGNQVEDTLCVSAQSLIEKAEGARRR